MAHEIEGRKMIYIGEKPWHDRGVQIDASAFAGLTPEQAIAKAIQLSSLDYTVSRVQLRMPAVYESPTGEVITGGQLVEQWAVVRDTDQAILGFVGPDWRPVQNAKAFSPLAPFLKAGCTIETAGCLFSGARVWMLLKVNKPDSVIVSRTDDRVAKYLLAAVGHDGKMSYQLGYTPTRVVCNNTLSIATSAGESSHVRIRHGIGADAAIDALTAEIEKVDARFERTADIFRALAAKEIRNAEDLHAYFDAVFPPAKRAAPAPEATPAPEPAEVDSFANLLAKPRTPNLLDTAPLPLTGAAPFIAAEATPEPETRDRWIHGKLEELIDTGKGHRKAGEPLTLWHAYNAVTEYNTWERGRTVDNRVNNVMIAQTGPIARALPAAMARL
jgi:phage/plasmid-like protein (TIGR03299 family)